MVLVNLKKINNPTVGRVVAETLKSGLDYGIYDGELV